MRIRRPLHATWIVSLAIVTVMGGTAAPAAAAPARSPVIVLPGATSAEGIAAGEGSTFYAGDFFSGDIFRGDVRRGEARRFIDAPDGRQATGMVVDTRHDLLVVAGGFTGQAYVYDTRTGATVARYRFGAADTTIVNDVALTRDGAWFTDSARARLYFVPIDRDGRPGAFRSLDVTGPAGVLSGRFNLNGIQAAADGATLLVAHSGEGAVFSVDPRTGTSAELARDLPGIDGIVLSGHRLWAVQNGDTVTRLRLSGDLTSATVRKVIVSADFRFPTTAARFGGTLAVVNAKLDTGFPPTADRYEVVRVGA